MRRMKAILRRLWGDETGQDLAEYGIALAVISIGVATASWFVGLIVAGMWEDAQGQVDQVTGGS